MRRGESHGRRNALNRSLFFTLPRDMTIEVSVSGSPAQLWMLDRLATLAVWAVAALILLTRDPFRLLDAQLWAEDGPLWLYDSYMKGLRCLLIPHTGYLQTFPRLVGFVSDVAPMPWIPTLFALAGFSVQLAPAWLLLSARGRVLIPNVAARLLMVGFYLGVPNSFETFVNITNAQWHIGLVMFLLVVMPAPRRLAWRFVEYFGIFIGGLSGPFGLFLTPLAWWRAWRERGGHRAAQAAVLTVTALAQLGIFVASAGTERHLQPLGASISAFARILVGQVFLAGIAGAGVVARFETTALWQDNLCPEALLVVFLAIVAVAFARGGEAYRLFVAFAALIMAAALWSPVISNTQPQWIALEVPGAGSRYYLMPILAWFAGLLVLAGDGNQVLRGAARALIVVSLLGVRTDWVYPREPETNFVAAAETFDAAPKGTIVTFREAPNPAVWLFTLTKK
jgi:hypothetical protein